MSVPRTTLLALGLAALATTLLVGGFVTYICSGCVRSDRRGPVGDAGQWVRSSSAHQHLL